jgi:hypothetical protein
LVLQLLKEKSFAYLNFDDDLLLKNFDEDLLIQALYEIYPDFAIYFWMRFKIYQIGNCG